MTYQVESREIGYGGLKDATWSACLYKPYETRGEAELFIELMREDDIASNVEYEYRIVEVD